MTIPLKEAVLSNGVCTSVSGSALEIGAINTIKKLSNGMIYGDNSDWIGIRSLILNQARNKRLNVGIVFGAGGTSKAAIFALKSIGCKDIRVWNRTIQKAELLAARFSTGNTQIL